jgi:small ligand-binding sensory domain FIST
VSEQVLVNLEGKRPDLALVFISSHHAPSYFIAPELLSERLGATVLAGCSAAGVVGGGREVERRPGVAVSAASLPDTDLGTFVLKQDELPDADAPPQAWHELLGTGAGHVRAMMLLPDPFTVRTDGFLSGLDYAYPGVTKFGALASGGDGPGSHALFLNGKVHRSGIVGLTFSGDVAVDCIVAQGCRPVGRPMVVTEADENIIRRLDGEPPLTVLQELFESSPPREQNLLRRSLQIGILYPHVDAGVDAGDFVVRNVLGASEGEGELAIGELVREGQIVQFHVRDADLAGEDLRALLEDYAEGAEQSPSSALMFSCLGRGEQMFGSADHDTAMFQDIVAPLPLAGFFSNGEISTAGGRALLHGYTTSFAVFRHRMAMRTHRGRDVHRGYV